MVQPNSFNLPVKIVRPFNTYGRRQSARAIIPTVISQLLSGKKKLSLGNLSPTRDSTFVKDTCKGFLEIFKSEKLYGEVTNIGMGKEISVGDLVKKISSIISAEAIVEEDKIRIRPGNSEVERLLCNNNKLITNTNWKPDYDLEKGLTETIDWLKLNIDLYKPEIYNV